MVQTLCDSIGLTFSTCFYCCCVLRFYTLKNIEEKQKREREEESKPEPQARSRDNFSGRGREREREEREERLKLDGEGAQGAQGAQASPSSSNGGGAFKPSLRNEGIVQTIMKKQEESLQNREEQHMTTTQLIDLF